MVVYEALKKRMERKVTFGEIKNTIRGALEPFLYKHTQRNPLVIPVILNQRESTRAAKEKPSQNQNQNQKTKPKAKPKAKAKPSEKTVPEA